METHAVVDVFCCVLDAVVGFFCGWMVLEGRWEGKVSEGREPDI